MANEQLRNHLRVAVKELNGAVDLLGTADAPKKPIHHNQYYTEEDIKEEQMSRLDELKEEYWYSRPTWWKVVLVSFLVYIVLAFVFRGDANPPEFIAWLFPW